MTRPVVNLMLLLAVVVLVGLALVVGAPNSTGGEGEKFGGTDAAVTQTLEAEGYQPWFRPLFSPDSGEVESGLFAVQAALGAGVFGYCLGALRGRRQGRREADAADVAHDAETTAAVAPSAPADATTSDSMHLRDRS